MAVKTKKEIREWAKTKCLAWNWNCNLAEIAKELMDEDIETDSDEFRILGEEFVKFFRTSDAYASKHWEIVEQIIETFS